MTGRSSVGGTFRAWGLVVAMAAVVVGCAPGSGTRVVVAAGTTLVDSGFLQEVVDAYTSEVPDVTFSLVGVGSAEAVAYADAGSAQVIVTHEPSVLASFLARTPHAVATRPFSSSFVVVAPSGVAIDRTDVVAAFRSVADAKIPFVSRDDGSGTHARELEIWSRAGIDPRGEPWYIRAGAGMGATLLVADQRRAVALAELGAYLAAAPSLDLAVVPIRDQAHLENPYDVTVVFPAEMPEAAAFQAWLSSPAGIEAIRAANDLLFGRQVYEVP
jgi:tungstate transport system substrate-binding protein